MQQRMKQHRGVVPERRSGRADNRPLTRWPGSSRARSSLDLHSGYGLRQTRSGCNKRPSAGLSRTWRQRRGARRTRRAGENERAAVSNQPPALRSSKKMQSQSSFKPARFHVKSDPRIRNRAGRRSRSYAARLRDKAERSPRRQRETWCSVVIEPISLKSSQIRRFPLRPSRTTATEIFRALCNARRDT